MVHECVHATRAAVRDRQLQNLMQHNRKSGSHSASGVADTLGNYLGWDVYHRTA
jgi:hypothetical protein